MVKDIEKQAHPSGQATLRLLGTWPRHAGRFPDPKERYSGYNFVAFGDTLRFHPPYTEDSLGLTKTRTTVSLQPWREISFKAQRWPCFNLRSLRFPAKACFATVPVACKLGLRQNRWVELQSLRLESKGALVLARLSDTNTIRV